MRAVGTGRRPARVFKRMPVLRESSPVNVSEGGLEPLAYVLGSSLGSWLSV
jgi:hypothetical protein